MSPLPLATQLLLTLLVVTAAVHDLRSRRIPNWLVLAGLVLGVALNSFLHPYWPGFKEAAQGFGLALLIYFPLYILHAMGAGDVKLMAALGAMVGPGPWLALFIVPAILGGLGAAI